jgi:signal transduction histidine kinase
LLAAALLSPIQAALPYQPVTADPMLDSWRWRKLEMLDGRNPHCLVASPQGDMWFGVADGAVRYDGLEWTSYSSEAGLPGPVSALCCASNGTIFAAASNRVCSFSEGAWHPVFPARTNASFRASRLLVAADGSLWAGADGLLLRATPGQAPLILCRTNLWKATRETFTNAQVVPLPAGRFQGTTEALCQTRDGRIWIAFNSGELASLAPDLRSVSSNEWRAFSRSEGYHPGIGAQCIFQARDGLVWVGNSQHNVGLSQYNPASNSWSYLHLSEIFGSDDITFALAQTPDGSLWAGGMSKIFRYTDGKWSLYGAADIPLAAAEVYSLAYANNYLWLLGMDDCVQRVDINPSSWVKYQDLNFQCETPDGRQWFLSGDDEAVCFDGARWSRYGIQEGMIRWPAALLRTRQGALWAAGGHTNSAATAWFDGAVWHPQNHPAMQNRSLDYRAAFESADGSLWFGTYVDGGAKIGDGGILRYTPALGPPGESRAWTNYLRGNHATSYGFAQRQDGTLYSGSYLGLVQFDAGDWKASTVAGGERIDALAQSPDGATLWLGSRGHGLFRYDGRRLANITQRDGLAANSVNALFCDRDSRLWVTSGAGISYFDGTEWVPQRFPDQRAELQGCRVRQSRDGAIWLNQTPPHWTRRLLPNTRVETSSRKDFWTVRYQPRAQLPVTRVIAWAREVSQPGNTAISWQGRARWEQTRDEDLVYSYRLDGGPWSRFQPDSSHVFLELRPGAHRFEVRSRDRDLNTDASPARVEFTVLPPVWMQPWFLALLGLLSTIIAAQTFRLLRRDRSLQASNRALAEEIGEHKQAQASLQEKTSALELEIAERKAIQAALESQRAALQKEIEERKRMEQEVARAHQQLLVTSRKAGMAEIAANVLHNVGNTLNSLNTSAQLLGEILDRSRMDGLGKLHHLLEDHAADLPGFLTRDERGKNLPAYVGMLANALAKEREGFRQELALLLQYVDHIKSIVAAQQKYAGGSSLPEPLSPTALVDDVLRLFEQSLSAQGIQLLRDFADVPRLTADRHNLLQILINLISNAEQACRKGAPPAPQIVVRVRLIPPAEICIEVADNGIGIDPAHLVSIFAQDSSSPAGRHRFRLHVGAATAQEMGGSLTAQSEGLGHGAQFLLTLPLTPPKTHRDSAV